MSSGNNLRIELTSYKKATKKQWTDLQKHIEKKGIRNLVEPIIGDGVDVDWLDRIEIEPEDLDDICGKGLKEHLKVIYDHSKIVNEYFAIKIEDYDLFRYNEFMEFYCILLVIGNAFGGWKKGGEYQWSEMEDEGWITKECFWEIDGEVTYTNSAEGEGEYDD